MPKGIQGFVKGDPNCNRTGNRQPIVWACLELFTAWGIKPNELFPWDRAIPQKYKHIPQSLIYLVFTRWCTGSLIDKVIPDMKAIDVTTDGESLKTERPFKALTSEQYEQVEAIVKTEKT